MVNVRLAGQPVPRICSSDLGGSPSHRSLRAPGRAEQAAALRSDNKPTGGGPAVRVGPWSITPMRDSMDGEISWSLDCPVRLAVVGVGSGQN
jgi:hypothetical protein